MIRREKRKKSEKEEVGGRVDTSLASKKSKLDEKKVQNVGDIEDIPAFIQHKESIHKFSASDIEGIRTNLLKWYDINKRDLPWRSIFSNELDKNERNKKAYQVWVSEIMLQQTRVATVIDYFNKWIAKWPTLQDLANATLEEVNEMWSGLGYYRRAKFLHSGAQQVIKDFKGFLPNTAKELESISGIGKYTAGAISSIAFNEVSPLVDGNVIRVISRLRAIAGNSKSQKTTQLFWKLAEELVDKERPGCFNQALMEFGACLCTPTSPQCTACPVQEFCLGYKFAKQKNGKSSEGGKMACSVCEDFDTKRLPINDVTIFPVKLAKKGPRLESVVVCIVEREKENKKEGKEEKEYLLVKRPNTGLLAGLWEAPSVVLETKESEEEEEDEEEGEEEEEVPKKKKTKKKQGKESGTEVSEEGMQKKINEYLRDELKMSGHEVKKRMWVGEVVHVFSHIKQTLHVEYMAVSGDIKLENITKKKIENEDDFESEEEEEQEKEDKKKRKTKKAKEEEKKKEIRWVGAEEFHKSAVSKQMRKCFETFEKFQENGGKKEAATSKKPKKKETKIDGNQKPISSFFSAAKKK